MSDDHSVYTRGNTANERLKAIAAHSPDHREIYSAHAKYIRDDAPVPSLAFWQHAESDDRFVTLTQKDEERATSNGCEKISETEYMC